jgi:DnaK suppressor protein
MLWTVEIDAVTNRGAISSPLEKLDKDQFPSAGIEHNESADGPIGLCKQHFREQAYMATNQKKYSTRHIQLEGFERQLRERRAQLMADVRGDVEESEHQSYAEVIGEVRDSGDESNAELLTHSERTEFSRHTDALQDVDAALARIRGGSFGICSDCGGEIDINRLRAYPTAARCIECQGRFEKQHLSSAGPSL